MIEILDSDKRLEMQTFLEFQIESSYLIKHLKNEDMSSRKEQSKKEVLWLYNLDYNWFFLISKSCLSKSSELSGVWGEELFELDDKKTSGWWSEQVFLSPIVLVLFLEKVQKSVS